MLNEKQLQKLQAAFHHGARNEGSHLSLCTYSLFINTICVPKVHHVALCNLTQSACYYAGQPHLKICHGLWKRQGPCSLLIGGKKGGMSNYPHQKVTLFCHHLIHYQNVPCRCIIWLHIHTECKSTSLQNAPWIARRQGPCSLAIKFPLCIGPFWL